MGIVGDTAYLRGASVVALLRLAPTNPAVIYVGAAGRVRRKIPAGIRLRDMAPCDCVEYERIKCQNLFEALRAAKTDGAIEADRIADAARKALSRGLLSENEAKEFINAPMIS